MPKASSASSKPPITAESNKLLETLANGLDVLNCLELAPDSAMTLTDIANTVGMYKSRVMRICGTLVHMGYLIHDRDEKLYRLGPRLLSLGKAYERSNPILIAVKPVLESLFMKLKITASFYVLRGTRRVCIARHGPYRTWESTEEGEERELHYGSTGKIFLAFGNQDLREKFFVQPEPYTRLTPFTLTTAKEVWEELERVREKGYSDSHEERVMGLGGFAAPVFRLDGDLVGALSVACEKKYLTEENKPLQIEALLQAAKELSDKFGFNKQT